LPQPIANYEDEIRKNNGKIDSHIQPGDVMKEKMTSFKVHIAGEYVYLSVGDWKKVLMILEDISNNLEVREHLETDPNLLLNDKDRVH
jgi:hypothetical protein